MPNQNECDHVVGYYGMFGSQWKVERSRLIEVSGDYYYRRIAVRHNYCPNCGAKIDWDIIEEMVNNG